MPSQPSEASPAGWRSSSRSSSAKGPSTGGTPAASPSPQSSVKIRSKHISFTNGLLVDSELHGALGSPSGGPPHWEPSLGAQPSSHTRLPYSPGAPNPSSPLHGQRPHSAQADPCRPSYAAGGAVPTLTLHARNTLAATAPPTPKAYGHEDHSRHSAGGLSSTGIRAAADGLMRSLGVDRPASPSAAPPSPAKSPSGRGLPASTGRGPLTSQEAATWGRTMQAATASLAAVTEEVEERTPSPAKHHRNHHVHIHLGDSAGGLGAGAAAGGASEATHGGGHRVSAGSQQVHAGPAGGPQQQGRSPAHGPGGALPTGLVRAQSSAASMQQRLQHKFGEEAAAFMLHDLKQVPRALHPLFYTVVMQLRVLPSPLPASLGEAYAAVFAQHHSAVVEAPERKHQQYLQATASASAAAATQLAALAAKAAALGPPASRQTAYQQQAHAQLQQQQRQLQQQQAARQAEADRLAAAAAAGKQLYGKVKLLLSAMVAAGASRLSLQQLKVLGLDGVLEQLPGWGVLFHLDTTSPGATDGGLLVPVDPSLESWLVDAKGCPPRFLVDPRVGHAELGGHYRQQAESGDVRALDGYALGHMARHLVLSETEVVGAERLLLDAEFLEQVFRERQEATLYLGLMRLPQKTEIVSEVLRWLRANMAALRAQPRAVVPLWLTAPHRCLLAKLVRQSLPPAPQPQPQPHAPAAASSAAAPAAPSSSSRKLMDMASAAGAFSGRELQSTNGNSSSRSTTGGGVEGVGTPRTYGSPEATPRSSADATLEANPTTKTATITSPRYPTAAIIRKATRPQCTPLNPPPFWRIGIAQFPGHTGGVTALAFCKHNRILTAATGAGVLHVWDPAATTHAAAVATSSPSIPSIDLHPSCKLIAIGSSSEPVVQIRHFDSGTGMLASYTEADSEATVVQLRGLRSAGGVRQVSYSPDGHLLAVVYDDGSVAVWDPADGVRSNTMPLQSKSSAVRHASFSPDGQLLALACANGCARVWNLKHTNPLQVTVLRAAEPSTPLRLALHSPSGLLLATAAEGSPDVQLWDTGSGQQWQVLPGHQGGRGAQEGSPVRTAAFSPSGLLLAVAAESGDISLWSTNTRGQWSHTAVLRGHTLPVNALAFSPCGQVLASGGVEDRVRLWDVGSVLQRSELLRQDAGAGAWTARAGGEGAGGGGVAAAVMEDDEATSAGQVPALGVVTCLCHSPNGTQVAAGFKDGGVALWDTARPQPQYVVHLHMQHQHANGSSNGDSSARAHHGRGPTGGGRRHPQPRGGPPPHDRPVGRVVYSCDGKLLASVSDDGRICVWGTAGGVEDARLVCCVHADADGATSDGKQFQSQSHSLRSNTMSFRSIGEGGSRRAGGSASAASSPRAAWASVEGHGGHSATAFPSSTTPAAGSGTAGAAAATSPSAANGGWVTLACSVAFAPGGRYLVTAHDSGAVALWGVPSGRCLAVLRGGHARLAHGLRFSGCGQLLASCSDDGSVCVWEPGEALGQAAAEGGEALQPLSKLLHRDHVYAADFHPAATALATVSRDGLLCVWDPRTAACFASAPHGHTAPSKASLDGGLRYSLGGELLATCSADDASVRLWHAPTCVLLRQLPGLRLLGWPHACCGALPWAAVSVAQHAPFVVRLPERSVLMEAALKAGVRGATGEEVGAAAAEDAAEGLAGAAVGLPWSSRPYVFPRAAELSHRLKSMAAPVTDGAMAYASPEPLVSDAEGTPLRPAVRVFTSAPSTPLLSLRGRSLVMADSCSVAFYSVAL